MQFPEDIGFIHNDILDEWEKPVIDGKFLIWKNLNNWTWTLAYEDSEEYIHTLRIGSESDIVIGLKAYWRDKRLSELLGE